MKNETQKWLESLNDNDIADFVFGVASPLSMFSSGATAGVSMSAFSSGYYKIAAIAAFVSLLNGYFGYYFGKKALSEYNKTKSEFERYKKYCPELPD